VGPRYDHVKGAERRSILEGQVGGELECHRAGDPWGFGPSLDCGEMRLTYCL